MLNDVIWANADREPHRHMSPMGHFHNVFKNHQDYVISQFNF